jgi:hypothetical protein
MSSFVEAWDSNFSVFNDGNGEVNDGNADWPWDFCYGPATPIVTLNIGANVTHIPPYAFINSSNMTSAIILPDAVTTVGDLASYGCLSAPALTLGENMETIGNSAFYRCNGLTGELEIPASLISIESDAFYNCSGLTSVDYAGDLASWCGIVFGNQYSNPLGYAHNLYFNDALVTEITIPNTMNSIGKYTFQGCSSLTAVNYLGDLASWCGFSFGNEYSNPLRYAHNLYIDNELLTELIIPSTVTSISQYAFQGCSSLTGDLVIPNTVTSIGQYAFSDCSGFNGSLFIGNGIQTISPYTFAGCTGFTGSLILGVQVNNIGDRAFENCNGFTLLISENPNPVTAADWSFDGMNYSIPVYVPDAMVSNYQNATGWNVFSNYIPQCTFWDNFDNANWSDEMNWLSMELPTANDVVCIAYNCDIDIDVNVLHAYVLNLNDVLTVKSGHALNTTYGLGILQPSQLVIEDGALLYNTLPGMQGTLQKHINGYGTGNDGWYTIAAPVSDGIPVSGLTTGNYDLYVYDEPTATWFNQKVSSHGITAINPGQGFLYANQAERTLNLAGQLNASNAEISVPVSYTSGATAGFNLVGNPYTNNINITDVKINGTAQTAYYRAEGGSNIVAYVAEDNEPIKPGDGFFVKATEAGTLTFGGAPTRNGSQPEGSYVRLLLHKDGQVTDRAYLRMNQGTPLEKVSINDAHSLLYFMNGGERYAVADNEADNGAMPLYLEKAAGTYTIEASLLNAECDYLHLIDYLTGADIDLLATPSYTFTAKADDYAARFELVFVETDNNLDNQDNFAFISNGQLILTSPGTLQIFDALGRQLFSKEMTPLTSHFSPLTSPGVYVLRLINGENVRTQKIVVR